MTVLCVKIIELLYHNREMTGRKRCDCSKVVRITVELSSNVGLFVNNKMGSFKVITV